MSHDFVLDRPDNLGEFNRFYWVIYCRRCGYVSAFGNDIAERSIMRQENLPPECLPSPTSLPLQEQKT